MDIFELSELLPPEGKKAFDELVGELKEMLRYDYHMGSVEYCRCVDNLQKIMESLLP